MKSDREVLREILDEVYEDCMLADCIGKIINHFSICESASIRIFPDSHSPDYSFFLKPDLMERAKKFIYNASDGDLKEIAFLDSILSDVTVAIINDPEHDLPKNGFLKAPLPDGMLNLDRDNLWDVFQREYAKWRNNLPEENRQAKTD